MRLLVLGSSNAIGDASFVRHIARVAGFEVINRSIGASTSTAAIYATLAEPWRADYALIDCVTNDEGALQQGVRTADEICQWLRSLIFALRSRGCTPVLAIMPTSAGLDTPSTAEKLQLETCREQDVHVMNVADLYRRAMRRGGIWNHLQRDPFHISAAAAPIVAQAFVCALRALDQIPATQREWACHVVPMRVIPAAPLVRFYRRRRRISQQRRAQHAVLRQGDRLNIPVRADERLVGLVINSGAPGAKIALSGDAAQTVKSLIIYFHKERPDWFISIAVDVQPVPAGADGVRLDVLALDAVETEPTLHQQPALEGRYGEIEVEAFLVAVSEAPTLSRCRGPARAALPRDLSRLAEIEDLVERLAALRTGVL